MKIPSVARTIAVRYLGIQIASTRSDQDTWAAVTRATKVRLRLGTEKTADEEQRTTLAAAIVLPKLAYVARHTALDAKTITILQRCVHSFVGPAGSHSPEGVGGE